MNLLVLIHLTDGSKGKKALECATQIVTKLQNQNRRTLDLISTAGPNSSYSTKIFPGGVPWDISEQTLVQVCNFV